MSHRSTIIVLALLVAVMPFLGFPYSFEKYFYLVVGILIAVLAYRLRRSQQIDDQGAQLHTTSSPEQPPGGEHVIDHPNFSQR